MKVLKKMKKASNSKTPKRPKVGARKRSDRVLASGLTLDYCETKKRKIKEQLVIDMLLDENEESNKRDEKVEMEGLDWETFIEKEAKEKR